MKLLTKNSAQPQPKQGFTGLFSTLSRKPWIWAWLAAGATYLATLLVVSSGGAGALLYAAFTFASFAVIVGIGQMFVITLGPGNVDLSIPATMTLAGTLALKFMATDGGFILPGLLIVLGIGLTCGVFNFFTDPVAAHSAHYCHLVFIVLVSVGGYLVEPGSSHQTAPAAC